MDNYYEQINELILNLLLPARTQKSIDKETFQKFYSILEQIESDVRGKETIQRNIAGLIFFIYCSLSNELYIAHITDYQNELFRAVGKLEDILGRILWDDPCKK